MKELIAGAFDHWFYSTVVLTVVSLAAWFRRRIELTLRHALLSFLFRLRSEWNRHGIQLVTLDDYVALLERLRGEVADFGAREAGVTLKIYVFTMQLPRDWPLWATDVTEISPDKTALEQYFLNFSGFLNHSRSCGRKVDVRRAIVIENCDSPSGIQRFEQLREDVQSPYFARYIETLHGDPSQARYYKHPRPWPGWLTDAVFYGVDKQGSTQWLWGVTTSYNAGEDLILLRFHRMRRKRLDSRFIFPWGAHSLVNLVESMEHVVMDELNSLLRAELPASSKPASHVAKASEPKRTKGTS